MKKLQFAFIFALLLIPIGLSITAQDEHTIPLYDLGLLQLAAHDLFNVDRDLEIDFENGKLDLSTLLDHGYDNIILGGEPRNRENIILFSVAQKYGEKYLELLDNGYTESEARDKMVKAYHADLEIAYQNAFLKSLPDASKGSVTMTENLALRTIHDFLPGTILFNGTQVDVLDFSLHGQTLSDSELLEHTGPLDGAFDDAFRNITIFIPPDMVFTIDLFEVDSDFAEQFNTDFEFEYFMHELSDGEYDQTDHVMKLIDSLFSKALYLEDEEYYEEVYNQDNNPRDRVRISKIHFNEFVQAGQQYSVHLNLDNLLEDDQNDVRITAMIPELGVRSRTIRADLFDNGGETVTANFNIPQYTAPGYYTVKVVVDLDGVRRIKHREIMVQ